MIRCAVSSLVLAGLLGACSSAQSSPRTSHPRTPPEPAHTLIAQAKQLVPPGAGRVLALSGQVFQASPQGSLCTGAVDEHRLWTVAEPASNVSSLMRTSQLSWITTYGTGTEANSSTKMTAYITLDHANWTAPAAPQSDQVNFVVSAISDTSAGIRADAIMVPPGAVCPSAR